jgi:hypothetical protein
MIIPFLGYSGKRARSLMERQVDLITRPTGIGGTLLAGESAAKFSPRTVVSCPPSNSATRRFTSVAHAASASSSTSVSRLSSSDPARAARASVGSASASFRIIGGVAFHSPILPAERFRRTVSRPDLGPSTCGFREGPDTNPRGRRRGRRRQGGLLPFSWGSTSSRVRALRGDGRGDDARASITPSSGEYRTASRSDRGDLRSEARARNRIRGESLRTVSRAD